MTTITQVAHLSSQASFHAQTINDVQQTLASGIKSEQTKNQAALLALADRFAARIQGLNHALLNVNDGIGLTQIAAAGLQDVENDLARLRELSVQGANDTLNPQDRLRLQQEAQSIQQRLGGTVANTQYNGIPLLTGNAITLQTGPEADNQHTVPLPNLTGGLGQVNLATQAGAQNGLLALSGDMDFLAAAQAELEAGRSALAIMAGALLTESQGMTSSAGSIQNADMAQAAAALTSANIRNHAGVAILAQANQTASQVQNLL